MNGRRDVLPKLSTVLCALFAALAICTVAKAQTLEASCKALEPKLAAMLQRADVKKDGTGQLFIRASGSDSDLSDSLRSEFQNCPVTRAILEKRSLSRTRDFLEALLNSEQVRVVVSGNTYRVEFPSPPSVVQIDAVGAPQDLIKKIDALRDTLQAVQAKQGSPATDWVATIAIILVGLLLAAAIGVGAQLLIRRLNEAVRAIQNLDLRSRNPTDNPRQRQDMIELLDGQNSQMAQARAQIDGISAAAATAYEYLQGLNARLIGLRLPSDEMAVRQPPLETTAPVAHVAPGYLRQLSDEMAVRQPPPETTAAVAHVVPEYLKHLSDEMAVGQPPPETTAPVAHVVPEYRTAPVASDSATGGPADAPRTDSRLPQPSVRPEVDIELLRTFNKAGQAPYSKLEDWLTRMKGAVVSLDSSAEDGEGQEVTVKESTRRADEAQFWGYQHQDQGWDVFPGRACYSEKGVLSANDGSLAKKWFRGLFDIEWSQSDQLETIRPARLRRERNGRFVIEHKGQVRIYRTP